MALVIDASVALAWCFEDERSAYSRGILDRVIHTGAIAPPIWPVEVANSLWVAVRRNRLATAKIAAATSVFTSLAIAIRGSRLSEVLAATLPLALRYGLSVYDSSYLHLAISEGLPLATLDNRLRKAAESAGVAIA